MISELHHHQLSTRVAVEAIHSEAIHSEARADKEAHEEKHGEETSHNVHFVMVIISQNCVAQ
jgi:hypothetical protein